MVLLNVLYFVWSHEGMSFLGWAPQSEREPQRLLQQIEPERLHISWANMPSIKNNPHHANNANNPANMGTASSTNVIEIKNNPNTPVENSIDAKCLQAGMFNELQSEKIKSTLHAIFSLSDSSAQQPTWRLDAFKQQARWIVYLGPYENVNDLILKKAQLNKIKVPFETPLNPELSAGLSVGAFINETQAQTAMQTSLYKKGIRTAKVVQEFPPRMGYTLVFPAVDVATSTQLNTPQVRAVLSGKPLLACLQNQGK